MYIVFVIKIGFFTLILLLLYIWINMYKSLQILYVTLIFTTSFAHADNNTSHDVTQSPNILKIELNEHVITQGETANTNTDTQTLIETTDVLIDEASDAKAYEALLKKNTLKYARPCTVDHPLEHL